jgi:transcriptional antiterminator RfaH
MHWYLIHTKPRQETVALRNLEQQGYHCFLPQLRCETVQRGRITPTQAPLFPRYLFIHLDDALSGSNWAPIRSTKGVTRLVRFGDQPAKVDTAIIEQLQAQQHDAPTRPLFQPGDAVRITAGPFAGLQAVFGMRDGESRVMVLLELLSRPVRLLLEPSALHKAA